MEMRQEDLVVIETDGFQLLWNGPERGTLTGAQANKKWRVSQSCPSACREEHPVLLKLKAQPESDSLSRGQVVCFSHLVPLKLWKESVFPLFDLPQAKRKYLQGPSVPARAGLLGVTTQAEECLFMHRKVFAKKWENGLSAALPGVPALGALSWTVCVLDRHLSLSLPRKTMYRVQIAKVQHWEITLFRSDWTTSLSLPDTLKKSLYDSSRHN